VLFAFTATAEARKPIIAYVDQTSHKLALYDAETGTPLVPPDISITTTLGFQDPMAMSFDGRYVFYVGADDKLHLFDRTGAGSQLPLPGINVYAKPTGLSVSDTGLLAFDKEVNGPAVVYNSATGSFVDIGLPDPNADRQSHLSGDGHFLVTTCNGNAMTCPADNAMHSQLFVQDIPGATNTTNPPFAFGGAFDAVDKEHPCVNNDASLVGADVNEGGGVGKQVEVYDRGAGSLATPTGLNAAGNVDDIHCVMSQGAVYIGLISGTEFKVYERPSSSFLTLPTGIKDLTNPIWFVMPFPPPSTPGATPPGATPDTTKPRVLSKRFKKSYALAAALKHGLLGRITSNENGRVTATATVTRLVAKKKKPLKVASGKAKLTAGRAAKLRLKFTRRAKHTLAGATRVTLTIRITVKDAAGNARHAAVKTVLNG